MNPQHITRIAQELQIRAEQVRATAELLADGGTVPFIARYRKEATGLLDEVAIAAVRDRLEQLGELDKRREAILASLEERGLLSDELRGKVAAADSMTALEDVYLPYRPKRRTRAMMAREKGLEPLAMALLDQQGEGDLAAMVAAYLDAEKGVPTADDALAGARDIIAEMISEQGAAREKMRALYRQKAALASTLAKGKEEEGAKFRDYFEWTESAVGAPSHRLLAMFRGENEGFLRLSMEPAEGDAVQLLEGIFLRGRGAAADQVRLAIEDSHKRLLGPSMENELRGELKKRADEEAIRVFVENMRELLLAAPLGQKRVMAIDPAFRTGCKVVVLDAQGKLLHDTVIYPTIGEGRKKESEQVVRDLTAKFQVEAIAIGNGTASRETETFVRALGLDVLVLMVDEAGASIYSASDVAREEFPDKDVTVRGAVSIGRRLMDPLAELVKIDPKSIGVGQYQHDVDQPALRRSLDDTVVSCVNRVGVEVNTASKELLTYVAGLGPTLAKNIVEHRNAEGPFKSRAEVKKVKRLGPKAFEQCAGFLRVRGGSHPLDASAVHPESYPIVEKMAADVGCKVADLLANGDLRARIELDRYVSDKVGVPTLRDILQELAKPGRDPRAAFEAFAFDEAVHTMQDLEPGMKLPGLVTNVTKFGAFVDIGVHQDGLVHISHLADDYVADPAAVVKVRQRVMVTVMEVDIPRKRIALSMKSNPQATRDRRDAPSAPSSPRPRGNNPPANKPQQPQHKPQPQRTENWFAEGLKRGKK